MTSPEYLAQLQAFMPPWLGNAWRDDAEAINVRELQPFADGLARVDARADELLLRELDPRGTIELIGEWEADLGLPDDCLPAAATLQERQAAVVAQLTLQGGQSIPYFLGVAEKLGYEGVEITEIRPFVFGGSEFGGDDQFGPDDIRYEWEVTVPGERLVDFEYGVAEFGITPYGDWRAAEDLECRFRRSQPSHTYLIFNYLGAGA